MIKALTFDLDDTLWEVKPVLINAEQSLKSHLASVLPGFNQHFDQQALGQIRLELLEQRPELTGMLSQQRRLTLQQAMMNFGLEQNTAIQTAQSAFDHFLTARHQVTFFEDCLDTLAKLGQNFAMGALSNGNANYQRLPLKQYFSFGYSAESTGKAKPHPQMFNAALNHLQLPAEQVLHIGDNPSEDVVAAKNVGLTTVWMNWQNKQWPLTEPRADREISDIRELPALIAELNSV